MRIGLITVYVNDQEQARRFYTDVLGLRLKDDAPYGATERWLTVGAPEDAGGPELVLKLADEPARAFQQANRERGQPALSFTTADCQGEYERLTARGVVFTLAPTRMEYGGTDAVFDDGCGNLVNLHQA
jgi:catechol 2,3-dioxygenase-like lactoylglutathione lyase family enzyme